MKLRGLAEDKRNKEILRRQGKRLFANRLEREITGKMRLLRIRAM